MRRALSALAVAGLGMLLLAPHASAGDSITGGPYDGSRITTPGTVGTSTPSMTVEIKRFYSTPAQRLDVLASLASPSGLPEGCATSISNPPARSAPELGTTIDTSTSSIPCNGTYTLKFTTRVCTRGIVRWDCEPDMILDKQIKVAVRPANVTGVKAEQSEQTHDVTISWTRSTGTAPDFLGYRVERQTSGDEWTKIAEGGPAANGAVDKNPPAGGGPTTYRVLARRAVAPDDEIRSTGGEVEIDLVGPDGSTTTTTTTTPGSGDGGTADGGTAGDGGTSTSAPGDGTSTSAPGGGSGGGSGGSSGPRGRVGIGTKAPRLGTSSQSNFPPLLTESDPGFDEEIDYGSSDGLAGEGEDDLSSLIYDDDSNRGMAVPVATGFVLAAWAFHLRFLARAARPGH